MKKSRKNDVVLRANCIIRKSGFTNLSFSQIAKDLEITRENVHHYFKKKEDLGIASLSLMKEDLEKNFNRILNEDLRALEKLQKYFAFYKTNQSVKGDCPIVPLLSEYDLLPESMQELLKEICDLELNKLSAILEAGQENNEFFIDMNIETKAKAILTTLKGAVSYGKIYNNFTEITNLIQKDLLEIN